jgi:hypothetical protein
MSEPVLVAGGAGYIGGVPLRSFWREGPRSNFSTLTSHMPISLPFLQTRTVNQPSDADNS